ncbi:unnamed protein product, partial [Oikopleura dioica]
LEELSFFEFETRKYEHGIAEWGITRAECVFSYIM